MASIISDHELDLSSHEACNLVRKAIDKFTSRYDQHGGWHHPTQAPTPVYYTATAPATSLTPMQILAAVAFLTTLLQSIVALVDRLTNTTVIRRNYSGGRKYDDQFDKAQQVGEAIIKFQTKKWPEERKQISFTERP